MSEHNSARRRIIIYWSRVEKYTNILLCFQNLIRHDLSQDESYVAWKVIHVRPGHGCAAVYYSGEFGFAQCLLDREIVTKIESYQAVPPGHMVNLEPDNEYTKGELCSWSAPKEDNISTAIRLKNMTGMRQDLSAGTILTYKGGDICFEPAFCMKSVGDHSNMDIDFSHCKLAMYTDLKYVEGETLPSGLKEDATPIWAETLERLSHHCELLLKESDQGGHAIKVIHK